MRVATSDDLDAVVETISTAFHEDPVWSWAFPDDERRQAQYTEFWRPFVADWNRIYPRDDVSSDGLHLGPTAAAAMAHLVASLANPWRLAVAGKGPDACGAAVDAAAAG